MVLYYKGIPPFLILVLVDLTVLKYDAGESSQLEHSLMAIICCKIVIFFINVCLALKQMYSVKWFNISYTWAII